MCAMHIGLMGPVVLSWRLTDSLTFGCTLPAFDSIPVRDQSADSSSTARSAGM
jgi:hypothetical protein